MSDDAPPAGRVIRLEIPRLCKLPNEYLRMHWALLRKYKQALAWDVRFNNVGKIPPAPFASAKVLVERHAISAPDTDNLSGSVKHLLDCLVAPSERHPCGLGFIVDDNPGVMALQVRFVRVPKRADQKTVVIIEETVTDA